MRKLKKKTSSSKKVEEENNTPEFSSSTSPPSYSYDDEDLLSTGSTLLDLAISGGRSKFGGIPKGKVVEIFGPESSGKTALLSEACSAAQSKGGKILFLDPEGRLDKEYSLLYGLDIKEENYFMPDTVEEVFQIIRDWEPSSDRLIDVIACDSLAALSTKMEMEDKDQYGMRRAKEFSEGLRRIAREVAKKGIILLLTNQVRENIGVTFGEKEVTPGGRAVRFYSSLRIRVGPAKTNSKIKKVVNIGKNKIEKVIGITSNCIVKKSSVDDPFRSADISIIFSYGIDDIRDMLKYQKAVLGLGTYQVKDKSFKALDDAIDFVEENDLYMFLKESTAELWKEIESKFKSSRKKKRGI